MVQFAGIGSTIPMDQPTLPALTEDQQKLLAKLWQGAGGRTREAAMVLAREFALQPWQIKAWATHLGLAEGDRTEFSALTRELVGDVVEPAPHRKREQPAVEKIIEKECSRCKKVKPLSEFNGSPHAPDHRTKCCKDCLSQREQQYAPLKKKASTREAVEPMEIMAPDIPRALTPFDATPAETATVSNRYEMLYMLLRQLPEDGRWSRVEREKWTAAFSGLFEYLVRIEEAGS